MVLSTIPSLPIPAIDATASTAAIGGVTNNVATPNVVETATSASIVAISTAAQILSTAAAAAALDNEEQNALAFGQNIENLATQSVAAQTTLTATQQTTAAAQTSALAEAEMNMVDIALQSELADAALSEALTAAATTVASSPIDTELNAEFAVISPTAQALTELIAASALPGSTFNLPAPSNAITVAPAIVANASPNPLLAVAVPTNPAAPITDPAVAAAIAAYHVGDNLFADKDVLPEEIPAEPEIEVASITPLDGTKLDPHDNAREDPLYGLSWNWKPVQSVQKRLTRR